MLSVLLHHHATLDLLLRWHNVHWRLLTVIALLRRLVWNHALWAGRWGLVIWYLGRGRSIVLDRRAVSNTLSVEEKRNLANHLYSQLFNIIGRE